MFVAPYDDPYTIAGQGTVGQEIMKQCPHGAKQLTHIFVPVGGGGLIAGIAAFVKAVRPDIAIIGVEPTGAPASSRLAAPPRPPAVDSAASHCGCPGMLGASAMPCPPWPPRTPRWPMLEPHCFLLRLGAHSVLAREAAHRVRMPRLQLLLACGNRTTSQNVENLHATQPQSCWQQF